MSTPIFLYGFARSGTTLLTMMMDSHPEISSPLSVTGLWYRAEAAFSQFNKKDVDFKENFATYLLSQERIKLWKSEISPQRVAENVGSGKYEEFINAIHTLHGKNEGKTIWANMDIFTLENLEHTFKWFPNAKFVHIVRDVRDVSLSHKGMRYSEGNYLDIAQKWSRRLDTSARLSFLMKNSNVLVVRYENLILNTEIELKRICDHVGVSYTADMLQYQKTARAKIPQHRRFLWPIIDRPPDNTRVNRWKSELRNYHIYVIEDAARETMLQYGYNPISKKRISLLGEIYGSYQYITRGNRAIRIRNALRH